MNHYTCKVKTQIFVLLQVSQFSPKQLEFASSDLGNIPLIQHCKYHFTTPHSLSASRRFNIASASSSSSPSAGGAPSSAPAATAALSSASCFFALAAAFLAFSYLAISIFSRHSRLIWQTNKKKRAKPTSHTNLSFSADSTRFLSLRSLNTAGPALTAFHPHITPAFKLLPMPPMWPFTSPRCSVAASMSLRALLA